MSKEFTNLKDKFSKVISSNEQLSNDLKSSTSFRYEFDKIRKHNEKLSKQILELKNWSHLPNFGCSIMSFIGIKSKIEI